MKKLTGLIMFLMGFATMGMTGDKPTTETPKASETPTSSLKVEKMVLCTGVQDREPQGEAGEFRGGKVTCWMLVTGAEGETQVKQGWWFKGELMFEIPLTIRSARFRTWGIKTADQEGEWTVKATDAEGHVLKEASFKVTSQTMESETKNVTK